MKPPQRDQGRIKALKRKRRELGQGGLRCYLDRRKFKLYTPHGTYTSWLKHDGPNTTVMIQLLHERYN